MVPGAGEFMIAGWVLKPGSYPVKSALTLRGAVATGGGFAFAAQPSHVRLHRMTPDGGSETQEVDYAAIEAKQTPDVFIHDGDVIEVPSSNTRLAAYGVYKTIVDIVHVGAGIRFP